MRKGGLGRPFVSRSREEANIPVMNELSTCPPIDTTELFAPLHAELIGLLRRLTPSEWARPTVAPAWSVRDVAAHLLDTSLRRLSAERDGHLLGPDVPIDGYAALVG